ncbi:MAG: hypothetical protein FWB97_03050 [Oscillospiraceae bacterium]|nr:hypothetical protein [Oscillospiraceae bacterium]
MKLLKNRGFAALVSVVVIIAATLFGVYNSASRVSQDIEAMFFDGVFLDDQGFTQPGIYSHLVNISNATLGLVPIMEGYPGLSGIADELMSARRQLLAAGSIAQKESAARALRDSAANLRDASETAELTERDREAMAQHLSTINGAFIAIGNSRYNGAAEERLSAQSPILRQISSFLSASRPYFFHVPPLS